MALAKLFVVLVGMAVLGTAAVVTGPKAIPLLPTYVRPAVASTFFPAVG